MIPPNYNDKVKQAKMLTTGESWWKVYECLLYSSWNFSVDFALKTEGWETKGFKKKTLLKG